MTRLVLIQKRVSFDRNAGIEVNTEASLFDDRKRLAVFHLDLTSLSLLADIECARPATP